MIGLAKLRSTLSNRRLLWDLFMVWAVLVNLHLIAFDLTYLWLRPLYLRWVPMVTEVYDPVKGVEPHPLTSRLLNEIETTRELVAGSPAAGRLTEHVEELRTLSRRVLQENPFARTGQQRAYDQMKRMVAQAAGLSTAELENPPALERAVREFWPSDPVDLRARLDGLDPHFLQALIFNYHREYGPGGYPVDHFWLIDLPFLVLFWIEFLVRWVIALRRSTYARWFFFPIFNWYDLLGLIPLYYFRVYRLLRLVSMYMRLRRSELSTVGEDAISRTVAYVANIITEEVSDRVALRILSELHEEIGDGTHNRITRAVVEPRRSEIEEVVVAQIHHLLTDPTMIARARELLRLNLSNAVERAETLRSVPLPRPVLRPVLRFTGEVLLDTTLETIVTTLDSEEGRAAVRSLAAAVIDDLFYGPVLGEIEELTKAITLQVIDHMKEVVAVKKWAQPAPVGPDSVPPSADS